MNAEQMVQLRMTVALNLLGKNDSYTVEFIEKIVQYISNGTGRPAIIPATSFEVVKN